MSINPNFDVKQIVARLKEVRKIPGKNMEDNGKITGLSKRLRMRCFDMMSRESIGVRTRGKLS
jgi:hypothetical protein